MATFLLIFTAIASAIAWSGCGDGYGLISRCPLDSDPECCPCPVEEDCPDGEPPIPADCKGGYRTDAGSDAHTSICPGICVPRAPEPWIGPEFFYEGLKLHEPNCPEPAPITTFEGVTGPDALPLTCAGCACDAPSGSCKIPEVWTVGSGPCSELGGLVKINFNPPANWDGTCSADDAIPAGTMCSGQACVQSITISEPLIEETCAAHLVNLPILRFYGDIPMPDAMVGKSCGPPEPWLACAENEAHVCMPKPEPEFSICIYKEGEEDCPDSWTDRTVYYGDVDDQRSCSACGCDKPTDSLCTSHLTLASDSACSSVSFDLTISNGMPNGFGCYDLGAGIALGGKAAEVVEYKTGSSCTPTGGELTGDLFLDKPTTFCCLSV